MPKLSMLASAVAFAAAWAPARAASFLAQQELSKAELQQMLNQEEDFHSGSTNDVLAEELRPLFEALPKNEHGRLELSTLRYALQRHFAQKHGWHINGLSETVNSTTGDLTMKSAPSHIMQLFEERTHGQGVGLQGLAAAAATVADLIRREASLDLEEVYEAMAIPTGTPLLAPNLDDILKMYLVSFIQGIHTRGKSRIDYTKMDASMDDNLISWPDFKIWLGDLRMAVDRQLRPTRNPFDTAYRFEHVVEVAQEVGHHFGTFQNLECQTMKQTLMGMEIGSTGRVPLTKFYGGLDDPDWPFHENVKYLRALGALDEADPVRPAVIMSNYLSAPTHCVTPSGLYSVCCINECEGIMAQVERAVAGPLATPSQVADVFPSLESESEVPRNLTYDQRSRLDEIAARHDGMVPLHGRLFAQWMHHTFPRECRFPHLSGTTVGQTREEFEKIEGNSEVTEFEVQRLVRSSTMSKETKAKALPWLTEEELVASHRQVGERRGSSTWRLMLLLAVAASMGLPALKASKAAVLAPSQKSDRFLV